MKIVSMIMGAILVALPSAAFSQEDVSRQRAIALFKGVAYMEPAVLKKCTDAYALALNAKKQSANEKFADMLIRANVDLQSAGCLDEWSSIVPNTDGEVVITHARVEVVNGRLFIWYDSFTSAQEALRREFSKIPHGRLEEVKGVVIDLRGNEGGSVDELAALLNKFFAPAPYVKYMQIKATDYPTFHGTDRRGIFAGLPIEVLTTKKTASASEWMIAQLKTWYPDSTRIIGETTFGKNVIQCLRSSQEDQRIRIRVTCGKWDYQGRDIYGAGIDPDVPIDLSECAHDNLCLSRKLSSLK